MNASPTRERHDLSGFWRGRLTLNPALDVAAPAALERDFWLPLPWNLQVEDLKWPRPDQELSGIVTPVQNQNFREWQRKFAEGTIVLRRRVACRAPKGRRVFAVFEGSNYRTALRVNGQTAGEHEGGHLAFEFEVTSLLLEGENDLEIEVDNLRRKDACPQEQFNWQNYGGVYRDFYLEARPPRFIRHCLVRPGRDAQGWFADVEVALDAPVDGEVEVEITSGSVVGRAKGVPRGGSWAGRVRMAKEPVVWEPGAGGLSGYRVALAGRDGGRDEVAGHFGFRTVELVGGRVHLNGRAIRILGAAWHEQHPAFGNSVPAWQSVRDLRLMKQCGLNAVRTAHYPYAQGFYEACDREGMLCVTEMPCWQFNAHHFASPSMLAFCKRHAVGMVEQLGNHPSLIGWAIQTESSTFEPGAAAFFGEIGKVFKERDPTRFTMASESPAPPEHLAVVKKVSRVPSGSPPPTHACVDVFGMNDYSGWYAEKSDYLPKLLDHMHAQLPGKAMMVTEFGAEGIPGQRSLSLAPWTEDYQAELIVRHVSEILKRDWVAGFFLWLFMDYECASIGIRGINAKGLVDEFRRPKLAFNALKRLLEEAAAHPVSR
jgi:beta-glucuronidase